MHAFVHSCVHAFIHACIFAFVLMHASSCVRVSVLPLHASAHASALAYVHVAAHAFLSRTCACMCMHVHVHTHMHALALVPMSVHVCVCACEMQQPRPVITSAHLYPVPHLPTSILSHICPPLSCSTTCYMFLTLKSFEIISQGILLQDSLCARQPSAPSERKVHPCIWV